MIILERGDDYDFFIFLFLFFGEGTEISFISKKRYTGHRKTTNNKHRKQGSFFVLNLRQPKFAQRLVKFLRPLKTASELKLHCIVFFFLFLFFSFFFLFFG